MPLSVVDWIVMLCRREEMEYDVEGDVEPYRASPINRFRCSWYVQHLLHSFWRVTETTKSIHTFMKTPGAFGFTREVAEISPDMIEGMLLRSQQGKQKVSMQSVLADKDLPTAVRKAFFSLHQATGNLLGSDGHRRLLRKEGVAYTLRWGPPLVFTTPNIADNKQMLLLVVQGEEFHFDEPLGNTYREMSQRLAQDPVGQALVFELMIRLFFKYVLGLDPDTFGWRRGQAKRRKPSTGHHAAAFSTKFFSALGRVLAAFGPIEAQGRGSLHPHILVWLLLISMQELLATLLRNRADFKSRVQMWMRQLVSAIASVQQSAITELPVAMGTEEVVVPPLPFGPQEKRLMKADGHREMATATELDDEGGDTEQPLFFYELGKDGEEKWHEATRADLPLRGSAGEAVSAEAWEEQHAAETADFWSRPLSSWPSARSPGYMLDAGAMASMRTALPADEWIRNLCSDARDLVIGCGIHVCTPSCFKHHSNGACYICRHNFYHIVVLCNESGSEVKRRRRGKALRGCLGIFCDTQFGMAGRIVTFQLHPGECATNYAALVAMRCNVDVQDLRRVLPPRTWLNEEELEPELPEEQSNTYSGEVSWSVPVALPLVNDYVHGCRSIRMKHSTITPLLSVTSDLSMSITFHSVSFVDTLFL